MNFLNFRKSKKLQAITVNLLNFEKKNSENLWNFMRFGNPNLYNVFKKSELKSFSVRF